MEIKKKMRVTQDHWVAILDFAEQHPEVITNRFTDHSQGKLLQKKIWDNLTNKLNCLGQGSRTADEWRKTLADWKSKTKKKASQSSREFTQTGGGPSTTIPLTALEERLLSIMGRAATYGDSSTSEKGLKRQHTMVEVANDNEEEDLLFDEGVEVIYVTEEDDTYVETRQPSPGLSKESSLPTTPSIPLLKSKSKTTLKQKKTTEDMHKEIIDVLKNIEGHLTSIDYSIKSIASSLAVIAEK